MIHERFEARLIRETPNSLTRVLRHTSNAILVMNILLMSAPWSHAAPLFAITIGSFVCLALLRMSTERSMRQPKQVEVAVLIDVAGISVDGRQILRHTEIESGAIYIASDGRSRVVFRSSRRLRRVLDSPLVLVGMNPRQVKAMQIAARVDPECQAFSISFFQRRVDRPFVVAALVYAPLAALFFVNVYPRVASFVGSAALSAALTSVLPCSVAAAWYMLIARTTIRVGTDGVDVRQMFGRRFYRLDAIRDVIVEANDVKLALSNGNEAVLTIPSEPFDLVADPAPTTQSALIASRIEDAIRIKKSHVANATQPSLLNRNLRSVEAWLTSLKAIGSGACDYRTAAVPVEELRRLVADPAVATQLRVAAAVALRVADGDTAVDRIRIAARASAAHDVRELFENIADHVDDEHIQRELERLDCGLRR